jgi:protease I
MPSKTDQHELNGMKVAILVTDGFEEVEMTEPRKALEKAGAQCSLISPANGEVQGMNHSEKGGRFPVEVPLETAKAADYDAILLPGGVANPDRLRMLPKAVLFAQAFVKAGKPIAAICHGPWLLVEAGAVANRTLTSWPSLKTDIKNAGGTWVDKEVVEDGTLVTSRKPDDIPAFNQKMVELFQRSLMHAHAR